MCIKGAPQLRRREQGARNMRYRSKFLIAAGLAAAVLSSPATQAADLVVATDTAFVPFEFKQGDKYVGFDIDLWDAIRSEEHTSELQSLMRISYAVFCLKKKKN